MFRSGIIVMAITMLSRVLGLGRTAIIAYLFGASYLTDAYFSAFKIANLFRQLLGEGALGTVFIPVYNEKVKKEGEEAGKKLIFSVLNLLFIFLIFVFGFGFLFSSQIMSFAARGYDAKTQVLAGTLLKIMAVYILFIGLSGMICAMLNNFKKFAVPASTSLFFNIAIIVSAVVFGKTYGVYALAFGVIVGGLCQFLIVIPAFWKSVKTYRLTIEFKDESLKKIFIMIIPMLAGIFARQVNSMADVYFASFLPSGGVSALENATRIYNLPLGVFGISLSTIVYPYLSQAIEDGNKKEFKNKIESGLKILGFFIIPSILVLMIYSEEVIGIILGYGKFGEDSIKVSAECLFYYSVGLYFYTAVHLMSRAFYSMKNTKLPVIFSITSIMVNIVLNYILIREFQHIGLAISTAIASGVNFLLLYIAFNKKYMKLDISKVFKFLLLILMSSFLALMLSFVFENAIFKLFMFAAVYAGIWVYPLKRGGLNVFN